MIVQIILKRWPKTSILCATERAKEFLLLIGLSLQNIEIELRHPRVTKAIIEDAFTDE